METLKVDSLQTRLTSELLSHRFRLVAFGFGSPIFDPEAQTILMVFKKLSGPPLWVLCLAEQPDDDKIIEAEEVRGALCKDVGGEHVAPYAYRGIEGSVPYENLKQILDDAMPKEFPGLQLEWASEADVNRGAEETPD